MKPTNSVKIVEEFWAAAWKARNPAAIDDFVVDDFVITTGGIDIVSKEKFKEWLPPSWKKSTISGSRFLRPFRRRMEPALHRDGESPGRTMPFVKKGHSGCSTAQRLAVAVGERSTLTAASAAQQPHIPCTPPPGGVEEEHR
jgi:hypothetical protein